MMRFVAGAALCAGVFCGQADAQARGKPGIDGQWRSNFVFFMESPAFAPDLVVPERDAKRVAAQEANALSDEFAQFLDPEVPFLMEHIDGLPLVKGQRRSRVLVQPADGKLPYSEAERAAMKAPAPPEGFDGPEQRSNNERCLVSSGQPPIASFAFENQLQIVRTPGAVAIHTEYGDEVRVVPITDRHLPKALHGRLGDSIGRWEGNTLVVETVDMPDADRVRFAPDFVVSGDATVIERFTPVSDRELLYQFTVVDPKVYSAPWLAEFSWYRTDKPMFEHACHEGNYSLPNILAGARHEEAVARAAAGAH